jgi:signal transduction histidine kinase
MSSSRPPGLWRTVRVRLTLWFGALFVGFAVLLFFAEDALLRSHLLAQMDDGLHRTVREFEVLYFEFGTVAVTDEFRREASAAGIGNVVMVLRSPRHTVLARSPADLWEERSLESPGLAELSLGEVRFRTLHVPGLGVSFRLAEARTQNGCFLQVGRTMAADAALIRASRRLFAAMGVAMVLAAVAMASHLMGRAMSGVEQIARIAAQIGNHEMTARVPPGDRGREIEGLVTAFNDMLDRIRHLVEEIREVTDNVAHDLRSPITRIRGLMESAATAPQATPETRGMAGQVIEECDRLVHLIDTTLEIAEIHAGAVPLTFGPVDLSQVVRDACELFLPVAEDRGLSLTADIPSDSLDAWGSLRRLQRVVANLLDNAIKYTPPGGSVRLRLGREGAEVVLTVEDTGIGISSSDLPRIFDRFFRVDTSRSTPGHGLGLTLARALVGAHGGTITAVSELGRGSRFHVRLPAHYGP